MKVSDFTLAEYLPGRHFMVQSLWHKGTMLRTQAVEVISYFAAGNNPSGIFSMCSLPRLLRGPEAVKVTLRAIEALESAYGRLFVELKEDADGVLRLRRSTPGAFPQA